MHQKVVGVQVQGVPATHVVGVYGPCTCMAALEVPVFPLVKCRRARSSALVGTISNSSAAPASSVWRSSVSGVG